jgi:hypothetical protein
MLQAFVDECARQDGSVFVMAGYVAPVENWLAFSDDWQKVLDLSEHPHRPMAKAKMRNLRHPRGLRRSEMFYRVIEKHAVAAFSCTLDAKGMREGLAEIQWPDWMLNPEKLSNPYYFAFQLILESLAVAQEHFGIFEPVDFVFDEISCKAACLQGWEDMKKYSSPAVSKYFGNTPIFRPEEAYLPLQAADLYGVHKLSFPWEPKVDIPRVARTLVKEDFKREWRKGLLVHQLRAAGVRNAHTILARMPKVEILS